MNDTNTILQEIVDFIDECRESGETDLRTLKYFVQGRMVKEKKPTIKIILTEFLAEKDVLDLNFDSYLKDEEGEDLDFENYHINSIEGNIIKISHGGDWQEPKQAIYEFDGVGTLKLIGEGDKPKFS